MQDYILGNPEECQFTKTALQEMTKELLRAGKAFGSSEDSNINVNINVILKV